jgi:hypothetical protein
VKTITYSAAGNVDLFDIVSKKYLAKGSSGSVSISLPAGEASLVVVLPAGTHLKTEGSKVKAGETIIAYK